MRKLRYRQFDVMVSALTAFALSFASPQGAVAQEQTTMSAFELRPGVVVDPDRRQAYIMSADSGIEAIELGAGKRVWSTTQAAKPLAVVGDTLISQVEPSAMGNELSIVTLDTQKGEQRMVADTMSLPPDVRVSINDTLGSSFAAIARGSAEDSLVTWQHSKRMIRGIPPGDEETHGLAAPAERAAAKQPSVTTTNGTFRINLSSGAVSSARSERAPSVAFVPRAAALPREERLSGVPGVQFVSADGRHVLSSERVADDSVWDKFRLTVYDRTTGERAGGFNSHLARVPFFVLDSQVFFETGPFVRRIDQGVVDEPLKIRAVDLGTGQELWSRQVRDTAFRGPFPP